MDSFLQCIPPRRLGHLFCKRRSAQANFYQFRRKVRGSGTIRPSLRYAISVCQVHFSRRPAFETSGLRDFTANEHREAVASNQSDSLPYSNRLGNPGPPPVYSYAISITAKVRFFLLDQIWRFQPFPSLFAFQVGSKERVGKWNQTKGQIGLPSHSIS